jgi:subtilisin-like proprotein convertase family protein
VVATSTVGNCTGTTASATVVVKASPGSVSISPTSASICTTVAQPLKATVVAATGSSVTNSGVIALTIPDALPTGMNTNLNVSNIPTGAVITGIDVSLDISHTFNSDLVVNLSAPNGKIINLVNAVGADPNTGGIDFYQTVISSASNNALPGDGLPTDSITGTFAPSGAANVGPTAFRSNTQSFSDLFATGNGTWKLSARDLFTGDVGTLRNWKITIYYTLSPTFSWTPITGLYSDAGALTPYRTNGNFKTVYAKNTEGNYTYNATISFNGCTVESSDVTVDIDAVPVATRTPATQTVCSGAAITNIVFGTSNAVSGTSFNWTRDETTDVTGIPSSGNGNVSGTLVNRTSSPITVTFTATPTGPGATACSGASVTATVTVNPTPLATATPKIQNSCSGSAITPIIFGTSNNVSGTNYTWTRDMTSEATGIAASGTSSVSGILSNASTPTTVRFIVTAVGPGATACAGTPDTAMVTVYNPATIYTVSGGGQYCSPGAGLPVSLSNSQAAYSYQLLANGSPVGSSVTGTGSSIPFGNQTASGTYTVTASNTGCTTSMTGSAVITSTPTVTPSVSLITSNTTICANTNANFFAIATNGGTAPTYNFMVNDNSIQNSSSNAFITNTLVNGDRVSCVITSNNTCQTTSTSNSNEIVMTVNGSSALSAPAAITGTSSICTVGGLTYLANATANGVWASSNPGVATVSTNGKVTAISNGSTIITYTISSNGCSNSAARVVNVAEPATIPAIAGASTVCVSSTAQLTNSTLGGVWSSLTSARATVNAAGTVTGVSAGTATIRYTVTNTAGCSKFVVTSVIVNAKPNVPSIGYAVGQPNPQVGAGGNFCINKSFNVVGSPTSTSSFWSSSNTNVMTVTTSGGNGAVNLIALGSVTLTYNYVNPANGCSNSRGITSSVVNCASKGILGSSSLKSEVNFSLYPNPAKDNLVVTTDFVEIGGQITVTDLFGKQLKSIPLSLGNNQIDISKFSKGMYLVSVITNDGKKTKKLIVE